VRFFSGTGNLAATVGVKQSVETLRPRTGLMRRHLHQDEDFRRFAAEFLPTLLRGAYLLLRDIDLAEDAVQGTMLRVFRHWDDAQVAPEAYSRKVLINVCRDHWRRQGRRPHEAFVGEVTSADRAAPFDELIEDRQALEQALAQLPELQREVLVLRFFFDFSVAQAAETLEIPEGTVKSSAHRGLGQLRDLLSPKTEAEAC
jgi:RNA polymerase sigma-70 factor (sigma-E family)